MDLERWQKIQELFAAALACPKEQRADFLDEHCGGAAQLRQEVEALLRAESGSDSFLGRRIGRGFDLLDEPPDSATGSPAAVEPLAKAGKYEILREIGRGGFGTVFEGRDPGLRRTVAIKTCTSRDPDQRQRFFREGRIAAALRHPNITAIYDVGIEGDVPYLVQEYLSGRDLSELIAEDSLATSAKLDLLVQIASGLAHAHGQGVLHRDVKPSNVRVLDEGGGAPGRAAPGRAKILDFGIARLLHDAETRLTRTGTMIGTVGYQAPEQLRGSRVDQRADVFSFGVLAYELLSGGQPFAGKTFGTISYRLLYAEPEPLHVAWPACPDRRLSRIVGRCLEKTADRRWQSIDEAAAALREVRQSLADGRRPDTDERRRVGLWLGSLISAAVAIWLGLRSPDELTPDRLTTGEPSTTARPEVSPPILATPPPTLPGPEATPGEGSDSEDAPRSRSVDEPHADDKGDRTTEPGAAPAVSPALAAAAADGEGHEPDSAAEPSGTAARSAQPPETHGPPEAHGPPEIHSPPETPGPPEEPVAEAPDGMRLGDPIPVPGPGVVPPKVIEFVKPVYPPRARRRRQAARVIVAVYVNEAGEVIETFLKQKDDSGLGFNEAAVAAARRTRFEPATRDGVAGRMWTEIPYDFSVRR